jgi:HK97 family phage prohead protease
MNAVAAPLTRGFSVLEIRTVSPEKREISGWATTPHTDRMGDQVMPEGATFAPEIPLLLFHDATQPVGKAKLGTPTARGIPFVAHIPRVEEPGTVQDRVNEAWHSVRSGIISAVSIGFRTLKNGVERIDGGVRFTRYEIMELSLCPIPANSQALIHSVRSAYALADDRERVSSVPKAHMPPPNALAGLETRRAQVWSQINAAKAAGDDWGPLADLDRGLEAEILLAKTRAVNKSLGIDPDYGLTPAPDVARALESRLDALEAAMVQRVGDALSALDRRFDKALGTYGEAIGKALRGVLDAELPKDAMTYSGVHQRALAYRRGALVTDRSGAWIAVREIEAGERPGETDGWQLVLRGRDDGQAQRGSPR